MRHRSPSPANLSKLERVELILQDSEALQKSVNAFQGAKSDKEYKYLEEMLTRTLIKLDSIDSEGVEEVRDVRRRAVKIINASIDVLELKALASNTNTDTQNAMDTSQYN